jgi:hypothetical protein
LITHFEKLVHLIELKRFGSAPKGSPFTPLLITARSTFHVKSWLLWNSNARKWV